MPITPTFIMSTITILIICNLAAVDHRPGRRNGGGMSCSSFFIASPCSHPTFILPSLPLSFLSSWNVVGGWLTGYAGAQCQLVWRLIKNLLARYPPTTRADALAISFFPSSLPSFTPPAPLLVSVLLYI